MTTPIAILTITSIVLGLFLIACIIHIKKIQQELTKISAEQQDQNKDLRNLIVNQTHIITYLTEEEKRKSIWNHMGLGGTA